MGISNTAEKAIRIFHPLEAPENALDKVVLEWLDLKITRIEERIMEFERKYGMEFSEFDKALKEKEEVTVEEEDDWIDWGDYEELLRELKKYRREVLSQLGKH